ncbi:phosphatase PAP2 family protein [Desulfotomaculum nigrificans]|uniref:phosphatase PAP2 family protein n=1 Tax=Desulfotomaculum nigrificans TaxID=1565 RepID=UPI0001FAF228|nr:phosphatase PAP2 family protein [Desulfotomaculum nigrificans]
MNSFDTLGYHFLNNLAGRNSALDHIIIFFANYSLELYVLLFVIAWFTLPKKDVNRRHALVIMGAAGVLGLALNLLISQFWFRARPFTVLQQGTFTQLISHSADASFPSDHTTGGFAFAAGSWGKADYWVRISFTLLAVLTGVARICAGIHWPTDVLGGIVVGTFSGRIMWKFSPLLQPLTNLGLRLFHFGQYEKHQPNF